MLRKFGIIAVLSLMALALAAVPALAATDFEQCSRRRALQAGFR